MRRFLCSMVVLGLASAAWAQTGTARGKVVDDQGKPVADAKVLIEFKGGVTRTYEATTNKKGEFTQVGLVSGVYRFTASKSGYQPIYIETKIAIGEPTYLGEIKLSKVAAAPGAEPGIAGLKEIFDKAIQATQENRLDEAEALYKEALVKHPNVYQIHYNLGVVYALKKDPSAAEAAYLKSLEINPGYVEAVIGLSNVYFTSGQGAKAQEMLSKLAAEKPDDAKLQFQLGIALFNSGQSDGAQAAFKKAGELDPSNIEVHYYLGTIAIGQDKKDESIAELEKYLAGGPTNPQNKATAEGLLAYWKTKK